MLGVCHSVNAEQKTALIGDPVDFQEGKGL